MNMIELDRALRTLRLSGMADSLEAFSGAFGVIHPAAG